MKRSSRLAGALACAVAATCAAAAEPARRPKGEILVVMSGADRITMREGKEHRTGYFLVELTGPAMALQREGYELSFANPTGREPAMDVSSDAARWYPSPAEYAAAKEFVAKAGGLRHPAKLSSLTAARLKRFKGLFVPGGHAPMQDLHKDPDMGRILRHFHRAGKTTALICHAPVALLAAAEGSGPAPKAPGSWPYRGYRMTVFSDDEELQSETPEGLGGRLLFYPGEALKAVGGVVSSSAPWTAYAVVDRELVTGQNPMSEAPFTRLFLESLEKTAR